MSDKILRHGHSSDTAANWRNNNPILGKGEIAIESDTGKFKFGNGVNKYNDIDYSLSNLVNEEVIERIKYYDDPDIIPSDESYFTVNETGETITGLTDTGKAQTKLVIPYKINNIEITELSSDTFGASILDGNTVIRKVVIPNSVIAIGYGAFFGRTSLTSVNIPNSVTSIIYGAFESCTSLIKINIPNSVKNIGNKAFKDCTSLTSINIPNGVGDIGEETFEGCTSLKSINIPNSVTGIGNGAFYGCTSLKTINIPSSVTSINWSAF